MVEKIKAIKFPQDELAHNHIIEWWYWNGNLKDEKGNGYSFMSCFFRADPKKVKIRTIENTPFKVVYFYHSIVTDIKKQKSFPTVEIISSISEDSFKKPLLFINHTSPLTIAGYTNRVMESTAPFSYHIKDEKIDLQLVSTKKPLLEGGKGHVSVHSKNSYYYSLTNLKTKGKLKIGNKWIEVTGKSWMDHQWANTPYTRDKWTWFSIQLDDNREIVCYEYDDKGMKTYLASLSEKDGSSRHFNNVQIIPLGKKWISKKTQAVYPISWKIKIPKANIILEMAPFAKNQEMLFGSINYWEGPMSVKGTFDGKNVSGKGFLELVGYPSKYNDLKYARDKIQELAKQFAKQGFSYAKKRIFKI